jgi:hypothetical protein
MNQVKAAEIWPEEVLWFALDVVKFVLLAFSPARVATWCALEVPWGHLLYPLQRLCSVGEPARGPVLASFGPCPLGTCYLLQGGDLDFLQRERLGEQTGQGLGVQTG